MLGHAGWRNVLGENCSAWGGKLHALTNTRRNVVLSVRWGNPVFAIDELQTNRQAPRQAGLVVATVPAG